MNKLLIICGPTATGKTSLGITLAKKFGGEIVSADSRQVYKGMDIGTGKDIENGKWIMDDGKSGHWEVEEIPVWLLDVVEPNQEFNVAQYIDLGQKVMVDIWRRKKLPIIVGGTGFYIKGLIDGIETLGIKPNWELRNRLEKLPVRKLFEILARLDSGKAASMNASDRKNPRRLIRAIEIATRNRKLKTENRKQKIKAKILIIGLKLEPKELYQRIDERVEKQVKMGAEEEVKKLIKKGYQWNLPAMSALGYQEWRDYFENKATKEEVIQKWKFNEHGYARRQMTWFKRDKRVHWFDITEPGWQDKVEQLAESWYNSSDA